MIATLAASGKKALLGAAWTLTSDVIYSGALGCDVYKQAGINRPALCVIHGGGWTGGDKSASDVTGTAQLFATLGYSVFNANLTLTAGAPAMPITDLQTLVNWVRTNAATYNVDAARVYMLGMSSGGHLAFMAAVQGSTGTTRPDAVIGWSPPCDLGGLTGDGATFAALYMGNAYIGNQTAWDAKSPRQQITSACCPMRVVGSASEDVNAGGIAQSQYDNMLTAASGAGISVTERVITGTVHADFRGVSNASGDVNQSHAWLQGL